MGAVGPGLLLARRRRHPGPGAGHGAQPASSCRAGPSTRSARSPAWTTTPTRCCRLPRPTRSATPPRPRNDYRVLAPAAGHRPERQPGRHRRSTCWACRRRPRSWARRPRRLGDQLTGFTADLDDATLAAQFADPLGDPAAVLGNATTRTLYDLGAYQRTSGAAQPSPPAVLHPGPRDARLGPGRAALPRRPDDHELPVRLRLLRRLRPRDPAQGPGRARPGHRRRPAGLAALGRLGLDHLRQQGPAGTHATSPSSPRPAPSSSPRRPA